MLDCLPTSYWTIRLPDFHRTRDATAKVTDVVSASLDVVDHAYVQFEQLPLNTGALAELKGSSETHAFEYFASTGV